MDKPIPVARILRGILSSHGIVMSTKHGPFGPDDIEREVLNGSTKDQALDTIIARIMAP